MTSKSFFGVLLLPVRKTEPAPLIITAIPERSVLLYDLKKNKVSGGIYGKEKALTKNSEVLCKNGG